MNEPFAPTAEEMEKFYAVLGRAITDWAKIERELFEITAAILGCKKNLCSIVFYRTPTIDSRLTLTDDLIESLFPYEPGKHPDVILKEWRILESDIRSKLKTRNALAHQPVYSITDVYESTDGEEVKFKITPASYISMSAYMRNPRQSQNILTSVEVEKHIAIISKLLDRLKIFFSTLSTRLQERDE